MTALATARAELAALEVNPLWGHEKQTAEIRKDALAVLDRLEAAILAQFAEAQNREDRDKAFIRLWMRPVEDEIKEKFPEYVGLVESWDRFMEQVKACEEERDAALARVELLKQRLRSALAESSFALAGAASEFEQEDYCKELPE